MLRPKPIDYAMQVDNNYSTILQEPNEDAHHSHSDAATNSSDEFWDDAAREAGAVKCLNDQRAKRGRRLYLSLMRLYRPIRILFVAIFVAGILITPFLVVTLRFPDSVARPHVAAWSIWFTISWGCGALISILIDITPRTFISLILSVYGKPPESLARQLEVRRYFA